MPVSLNSIQHWIKENLPQFHLRRLERLKTLKLKDLLKRKNPYLFCVKQLVSAEAIVKALADAHLSSQEETIFGDWLEQLAIFICQQAYGGQKSTSPGIDLEFTDPDGKRNIVSIKSGPNWGNSSQIKKLIHDFNQARKVLKTSNSKLEVRAVNGCCYGKENNVYKADGDYYKYCGQEFWAFISGENDLYLQLIEPLAAEISQTNAQFTAQYDEQIAKLSREFEFSFCFDNKVAWQKLVEFNSKKA
jgi:hypothetical protein